MSKATFSINPFPSLPCEIFNCASPATHIIHDPDGPLSISFRLCAECADNLVKTYHKTEDVPTVPLDETVIPRQPEPIPFADEGEITAESLELTEPQFQCTECDRWFKSARGLQSHYSQVHE